MKTFNWYLAWGLGGYLVPTIWGSTPVFTKILDIVIVFFCLGYINWRLSKGDV